MASDITYSNKEKQNVEFLVLDTGAFIKNAPIKVSIMFAFLSYVIFFYCVNHSRMDIFFIFSTCRVFEWLVLKWKLNLRF